MNFSNASLVSKDNYADAACERRLKRHEPFTLPNRAEGNGHDHFHH
jgi:hypothetical protein